MNASVVSLSDFAARVMRRPLSDEQMVRKRVRKALTGRCGASLIAQAEARAERLVRANAISHDRIVERIVAWATSVTGPNEPPPPLAA